MKDRKKSPKKPKVVYKEDTGETIYSMAMLNGKTPEEQEADERRKKNHVDTTRGERFAMMRAAYRVYGPVILIFVLGFAIAGLLLWLLLR